MNRTTYIIKFQDEHGDWFYSEPDRWSDSANDAYHFADKLIAQDESLEAASRLNHRQDGWHPRARCRVISMRET